MTKNKEKKEKKPKKEPEKVTSENFDKQKFIIKELRGAFKKTPMYNEAKNRAKREFFVESKHGKLMRRVHYECLECKRFFLGKKGSEIAVDHRVPVVDVEEGFVDLNTYADSLFCSLDNLDVLCNYSKKTSPVESCHKKKTRLENAARAEAKKLKKEKS